MNEQELALSARRLWLSLMGNDAPSLKDLSDAASFPEEIGQLVAALSILLKQNSDIERREIDKSLSLIAAAIMKGMPITNDVAYVRNELVRRCRQ